MMKRILKNSSRSKNNFGMRVAYLSKKIAVFGLLSLVLGKMQFIYDLIKIVKPLQTEVQFCYGFMFGFAMLMVVNIITSVISFVCKFFSVPDEMIEN